MDKHTLDLIAPYELSEEDKIALEDIKEYEKDCKEGRRVDRLNYKLNNKT